MGALLVHGDYGCVMTAGLEAGDVARIELVPGRWGIGLGAPGGEEGFSRFGEALAAGRTAAVLPAGGDGPETASGSFRSAYLALWRFEEALCYYSPPSRDWSFSALLEQIFNELSRCSDSPGLYAFCAVGGMWLQDVQALVVPPFVQNAPKDGGPINSKANYSAFLRRIIRSGRTPFVSGGLFLKPSRLSLRGGEELVERAFGPSLEPADFHFHAHAALFGENTPLDLSLFHSPGDVEDFLSEHKAEIVSVEHVLGGSMVFETRCFITPLSSLEPFEG